MKERKLNDIWVNWFTEENPYLVPHFEQWSKNDQVDLTDTIPLLYVNTNLYDYIAFGFNKIADDILETIRNKTYFRFNSEYVLEKYAFICTDNNGVMAVILDHNGNVIKKSYLIPRQHQMVLGIIKDEEYHFELENKVDVSHYNTYIGLTRLEKDILTKTVDFIKELVPEKLSMLKYIVAEWDLGLHKKILGSPFDEIKSLFLDEILGSETSRLVEFNTVIDKLVTK